MRIAQDPLRQQRELTAGCWSYSLNHVLNNQLGPVLGFSELIAVSPAATEKQKKACNAIAREVFEAARFLRLVRPNYLAPDSVKGIPAEYGTHLKEIVNFVDHGRYSWQKEKRGRFEEADCEERRLVAGAFTHSLKTLFGPRLKRITKLVDILRKRDLNEVQIRWLSSIADCLAELGSSFKTISGFDYPVPRGYLNLPSDVDSHLKAVNQIVDYGILLPRFPKPSSARRI